MAITFNNITSGQQTNATSSISSSQAGTINSSGADELICILFATSRTDTVTHTSRVTGVSATGLTFEEVIDENVEFNVGGSFPITNWHLQLWVAPASSQQTAKSWTSTMSDGFTNWQAAIVFAVDGLGNISTPFDGGVSPSSAVTFTNEDTDTTLDLPSVSVDTTDTNTRVITAFFDSLPDGESYGSALAPGTGWTAIDSEQSVRQYAVGTFLAMYRDYTSPQTATAQDANSNRKFWIGVSVAFTETGGTPTVNERATSAAAEVLHTGTAEERVTSAAAEVLHTGTAAERVTSAAIEVLVSSTPPPPLDGGTFLEARFQLRPSQSYSEADYDSIWSIGDRNVGNHMTFGEYDLTTFPGATMASSHDGNVAFPFGSGLAISSNPLVTGAGAWLDFGSEFVDIRGYKFIGTDEYAWADDETWSFYGAVDIGLINDEPYPTEFDAFTPSQQIENTDLGLFESEWEFTPRANQIWTHYEFVFVGASQAISVDSRFSNEILYKVAHSTLDGGDRRLTNSRPDKRVAFSMSSAWTFRDDVDYDDPASSLFDGAMVWVNGPLPGGDEKNGLGNFGSIYKAGVGGSAEQDTIGAWLQFVYPREVTPRHICFVTLTQVEEYIGDVPQHFGTWHWEFSKDSGSTWVAVGEAWSFAEDAMYMVAPRFGAWDLSHASLGNGATHWRMVLNSGPAFRSNYKLGQILFDLNDPGSLTTNFRIDFSDDVDGVLPTPTIVGSSPYQVKFSDGSDDVLTFTLTNTPNFDGTIAFSDSTSDRLEYVGSFSPTFYPQTVVVATGRR